MLKFRFIVMVLAIVLITSCATSGRVTKVTPDAEDISIVNRHNGSVYVRVAGGKDEFVAPETVAKALVATINKTRVFDGAMLSPDGARYELRVRIADKQHIGFTGGRHRTESQWELRDQAGKTLWSADIDEEGTSAALGGIARVRSAAERSSKAIIITGVKQLGELNL